MEGIGEGSEIEGVEEGTTEGAGDGSLGDFVGSTTGFGDGCNVIVVPFAKEMRKSKDIISNESHEMRKI